MYLSRALRLEVVCLSILLLCVRVFIYRFLYSILSARAFVSYTNSLCWRVAHKTVARYFHICLSCDQFSSCPHVKPLSCTNLSVDILNIFTGVPLFLFRGGAYKRYCNKKCIAVNTCTNVLELKVAEKNFRDCKMHLRGQKFNNISAIIFYTERKKHYLCGYHLSRILRKHVCLHIFKVRIKVNVRLSSIKSTRYPRNCLSL